MAKHNKNNPKWLTKDTEDFFKALLKIRNVKECEQFLRDLMTIPEIKIFSMRWKVAKMLDDGETYKNIEKQTGMSSTTIARINRWLEYGEGGYRMLLKRMKRRR